MHETFFASVQTQNQNIQDFVPSCLEPSLFVTFVYDNGDHNAESLFGLSLHCTNGIAIQNILPRITLRSRPERPDQPDDRRRSLKPLILELDHCISGRRHNPTEMRELHKTLSELDELISKSDDIIWVLAQYNIVSLGHPQLIPGWTGFHHLTGPYVPPTDYHQVAYLPSINSSPTNMSTVKEILVQVKKKSEKTDSDRSRSSP